MKQHATQKLLNRLLEYKEWSSIIRDIEEVQPKYSLLGELFSFGYAGRVRREAIAAGLSLIGGIARVVVDVGAGPGDSIRELAATGRIGYIVAIEPSSIMVQQSCGRSILCEPVQAVAEYLPLRSNAAELTTSFYAVRDYKDTVSGLREMSRVSRVIAIGDIFVPDNRVKRVLVKAWICVIVPLLAGLVYFVRGIRYSGICRSLRGWCSLRTLAAVIADIMGKNAVIAVKEFVLGGLGYVVAAKNTISDNRGERGKVRNKTCRSSSINEETRGDHSNGSGSARS